MRLRKQSGVYLLSRRLSLQWYENRTNKKGWVSMATNIMLPGLSIHANLWREWHPYSESDDMRGDERRLQLEYNFHFLDIWQGLRLKLSWQWDAYLPELAGSER